MLGPGIGAFLLSPASQDPEAVFDSCHDGADFGPVSFHFTKFVALKPRSGIKIVINYEDFNRTISSRRVGSIVP